MTLSKTQVHEYRKLQNSGVDVTDENRIKFNTGSETVPHAVCKQLVGLAGLRNSYRVDSEVSVENQHVGDGEVDVLLWAHDSRLSYAVEVETSIAAHTKQRKKDKYVDETAIDDILMLNVAQCPMDMVDAYGWVATQLGFDA